MCFRLIPYFCLWMHELHNLFHISVSFSPAITITEDHGPNDDDDFVKFYNRFVSELNREGIAVAHVFTIIGVVIHTLDLLFIIVVVAFLQSDRVFLPLDAAHE